MFKFIVFGAGLVLALLLGLVSLTGQADAITNGTADGSGHPYVGALVDPQQGITYCSGTLISEHVFLTAAHCAPRSGDGVTFASRYEPGKKLYKGFEKFKHPELDLLVLKFREPIRGRGYATLPKAGSLNRLAHAQKFTAVGYGADISPTGKPEEIYDDARMQATSEYKASTPTYLKLLQVQQQGLGGTCYGDSGGPNFVGDSRVLAATTITGDYWCRAIGSVLRLDTLEARHFLGKFVALP